MSVVSYKRIDVHTHGMRRHDDCEMDSVVRQIFKRKVPVHVHLPDREARVSWLTVTMTMEGSSGGYQQVFRVQLTDEDDPFFLYTTDLTEEEFQVLKHQQNLLVDFQTFPEKVIDLLKICVSHGQDENPRYLAKLSATGSATVVTSGVMDESVDSVNRSAMESPFKRASNATAATSNGNTFFSIIEANMFKHLEHLVLRVVPGSVQQVKQYLGKKVQEFMKKNTELERTLKNVEEGLSEKLMRAEAELSELRSAKSCLEQRMNGDVSDLQVRHAQELTLVREKALSERNELAQQFEQERKETTGKHEAIVGDLQKQLRHNQRIVEELTDKKYELENRIRELSSRSTSYSDELEIHRTEVAKLRSENKTLDAAKHDMEKTIAEKTLRIASLQQQVQDRDELVNTLQSQHDSDGKQRHSLEDVIQRYKDTVTSLEDRVKTLNAEIEKGNYIIQKLQGELRSSQEKYHKKKSLISQMERVARDKQQVTDSLSNELGNAKRDIADRTSELERTQDELTRTKTKLAESQELLKSNEQAIRYLNKELNELQSASVPARPAAYRFRNSATVSAPPSATQADAKLYLNRSAPTTVAGTDTTNTPIRPAARVEYKPSPLVQSILSEKGFDPLTAGPMGRSHQSTAGGNNTSTSHTGAASSYFNTSGRSQGPATGGAPVHV